MGSNILNANVIVEGTRSILWNSFNNELLDIKLKKSGSKGNCPDEWKKTVLVNDNKQLYLLPESIFGCIREGSKYTKNGRGTMQSMVTATLQIVDSIILTDRFLPVNITRDIAKDVYLDVRSVKNPTTRGRNIRYRAAAKAGWKINFNITWDCTLISPELMEAIIIDSGNFCGLGDGRSIGFGRFKLQKFELIDVILCQ
ncbi:hypothetical protein KPL47_22730 [Clostridium estertheticum]|nr:hypothetical protein [Clostridium estertheticum]